MTIALGILVLLGMVLIRLDGPPVPISGNAPLTEFSAERAMRHVAVISQAPHPVGSDEHAVVRDYIVNSLSQLGLSPEVQRAEVSVPGLGNRVAIENIVAGLRGTTRDKAVLLVAHYDSVFSGPGASDDGAGVAALLETARVFKSLPPFKRDVLFLLTDGEELGLLGARAFVAESPRAKDVGLVLNFDARGTCGPVILFETSDQNSWLIAEVSKAASHPVANSLSYEIYKRLPNDTDFTVFKRAGYSGLNFAFIDGVAHYHTSTDTVANLNPGSLQHDGDYATELGKQFANLSEIPAKKGQAIYFDILGRVLVHYSARFGALLLAAGGLIVAWILLRGFARRQLAISALLMSLLVVVVGVVAAASSALGLQQLTRVIASHYPAVRGGELDHSGSYVTAFSMLALGVVSLLYMWGVKRFGLFNMAAAGLLIWFNLSLAAMLWLSGMTYLWIWPLLVIGLAWLAVPRTGVTDCSRLLLAAAAVPVLVLIVPMIHKIFTAFAFGSGAAVSSMLALLMALCVVQVCPTEIRRLPVLAVGLFAAGTALFAITLFL